MRLESEVCFGGLLYGFALSVSHCIRSISSDNVVMREKSKYTGLAFLSKRQNITEASHIVLKRFSPSPEYTI